MGVLNVTPDSFSDGGKYNTLEACINYAKQMINDGADIIDIGGQSTRPGYCEVSINEELQRVLPVIKALRKFAPEIPISIDTYFFEVAKEALAAGANIINDIH
jgi:dihydropteroate synthase